MTLNDEQDDKDYTFYLSGNEVPYAQVIRALGLGIDRANCDHQNRVSQYCKVAYAGNTVRKLCLTIQVCPLFLPIYLLKLQLVFDWHIKQHVFAIQNVQP